MPIGTQWSAHAGTVGREALRGPGPVRPHDPARSGNSARKRKSCRSKRTDRFRRALGRSKRRSSRRRPCSRPASTAHPAVARRPGAAAAKTPRRESCLPPQVCSVIHQRAPHALRTANPHMRALPEGDRAPRLRALGTGRKGRASLHITTPRPPLQANKGTVAQLFPGRASQRRPSREHRIAAAR